MNVETTSKPKRLPLKHPDDIPPGTVFRGRVLDSDHLWLKTYDGLIILLDSQEYSFSGRSIVVRDYIEHDVTLIDRGPKEAGQ